MLINENASEEDVRVNAFIFFKNKVKLNQEFFLRYPIPHKNEEVYDFNYTVSFTIYHIVNDPYYKILFQVSSVEEWGAVFKMPEIRKVFLEVKTLQEVEELINNQTSLIEGWQDEQVEIILFDNKKYSHEDLLNFAEQLGI